MGNQRTPYGCERLFVDVFSSRLDLWRCFASQLVYFVWPKQSIVSTDKASTLDYQKGSSKQQLLALDTSIHKYHHFSLLGSREKTWNSGVLCRVHMPPAAGQWTRKLGLPGDIPKALRLRLLTSPTAITKELDHKIVPPLRLL